MNKDTSHLRTLDTAGTDEIFFGCREEDFRILPKPRRVGEYLSNEQRNLHYGDPVSISHRELLDALADSDVLSNAWIVGVPGEFQLNAGATGVENIQSFFGDEEYVQTYKTAARSTKYEKCALVDTRWAIDTPDGYGLLCLSPTVVDTESEIDVITRLYEPATSQRWFRVPITAQDSTYVRYGDPLACIVPLNLDAVDRQAIV